MRVSPANRQRLVRFILWAWHWMPVKWRIWAFQNDAELQDCIFLKDRNK